MADNGVVAGGRLTDWVSLGLLAAFVPRNSVDDAVAAAGQQARRSDGKLPVNSRQATAPTAHPNVVT